MGKALARRHPCPGARRACLRPSIWAFHAGGGFRDRVNQKRKKRSTLQFAKDYTSLWGWAWVGRSTRGMCFTLRTSQAGRGDSQVNKWDPQISILPWLLVLRSPDLHLDKAVHFLIVDPW